MSQHLNRLNKEEAVEFDKTFTEFCRVENQENKMNIDFYLTVLRQPFGAADDLSRQYYMAIFNITSGQKDPIFTSYLHPSLQNMIEVGKAYAKRLNIIYREGDTE